MKLLAITALALTVLLTACAASQESISASDDLSTSETELYSFGPLLPLPVSTKPGDTLYRSPMLGINIVDVLANGHPITAKPSFTLFVGIDSSPITVQSGTYIYNIDADRMLFWKQGKLTDLIAYSIPADASVLEIRYRLVPYDGAPDPRVYTMTARRSG